MAGRPRRPDRAARDRVDGPLAVDTTGSCPAAQQFVRTSGSTVAIGLPLHDTGAGRRVAAARLPRRYRADQQRLRLSTGAVVADGARPARYDKRHLVPFGEFVPWGFRWFVDLMTIPLGDFGRGSQDQPPLAVKDQRISFNICYEDVFGEELLPRAPGRRRRHDPRQRQQYRLVRRFACAAAAPADRANAHARNRAGR